MLGEPPEKDSCQAFERVPQSQLLRRHTCLEAQRTVSLSGMPEIDGTKYGIELVYGLVEELVRISTRGLAERCIACRRKRKTRTILAGPKMYFDGNWSDAPQQLASCAAFMRLTNWTPVCCDHLVISSCIPL